jgi:hypothetical protein
VKYTIAERQAALLTREWRKLRFSLLGKSIQEQIQDLQDHLKHADYGSLQRRRHCQIQVDHYLKILSHQGHLMPGAYVAENGIMHYAIRETPSEH